MEFVVELILVEMLADILVFKFELSEAGLKKTFLPKSLSTTLNTLTILSNIPKSGMIYPPYFEDPVTKKNLMRFVLHL